MNLIFDAPINNLSFGNVSVNILKELHKKKSKICLFPKTEPDLGAFDQITPISTTIFTKTYLP